MPLAIIQTGHGSLVYPSDRKCIGTCQINCKSVKFQTFPNKLFDLSFDRLQMYCGLTNQLQKCKLHTLFNNNKNSLIYPLIDCKCITTLQINCKSVKFSTFQLVSLDFSFTKKVSIGLARSIAKV